MNAAPPHAVNRRLPVVPLVADCLLTATGVLLLGLTLKALTAGGANVASLWLANGFALGMLLTARREHWPWMLLACAVGGVGGALASRPDLATMAWISTGNLLEVAVAAYCLSGSIRTAAHLTERARLLRFLAFGVVLAPALMTLVVMLRGHLMGLAQEPPVLARIFVGHAMGIAVMTPVVLALRNGELRAYLRPQALLESVLTLAVVALVSLLVFFQSSLPLIFLLFPPMIRVAFRGGFAGTAVAILIVTAIGVVAAWQGAGPISWVARNSPDSQIVRSDGFLLLQALIASLIASLFPLIMALAEGRRAHQRTEELQNRLRLLMEHSTDAILLTDLEGRRLFVSPPVRELLGIDARRFLAMHWTDHVGLQDQPVIGAQIEEAWARRSAQRLIFRTHHSNGRVLWIEASMRYFRDHAFVLMNSEQQEAGGFNCGPAGDEGFIITLRDITDRRQAELELADANAELAALVRIDSLTGLANRRRFDEALEQAWSAALDRGHSLAVLMIDVDHFKQFNDTYGHQRGDTCLKQVGAAISSALFHPEDLAARYGGEEFAVILPQTSTDDAARVAERIRHAVHELRRPNLSTRAGVVTVSVGVAAANAVVHGDAAALVRAADEALYTSKREGRNRTTLLEVGWPARSAPADPV